MTRNYSKEAKKRKLEYDLKWQKENRKEREGSVRGLPKSYRDRFHSLGELTKSEVRMLITNRIRDLKYERDTDEREAIKTIIKALTIKYRHSGRFINDKMCGSCRFYSREMEQCILKKEPDNCGSYENDGLALSEYSMTIRNKVALDKEDKYHDQDEW